MAKRGIKKKEHERLDDLTVSRVVFLLEQDKPITKKAACEILNIRYDTGRLGRIIQEYKDNIEYIEKRFKANKGRAFNDLELKEMIVGYLSGDSIIGIAKSLFRSIYIVKAKLDEYNLPPRSRDASYFRPNLMPDEMVSKSFEQKELVWSSRYNTVAEIQECVAWPDMSGIDELDFRIYRIWVFGKHNQFAYQPSYELGKLDVLKQFDLKDDEFQNTEKPNFNYRID